MEITDDELRRAYAEIEYDYESIRQSFLKDYGPETLKKLDGDELLKRLFASKDFGITLGKRGMFVWLEHGDYNVPKGTFGSGRDMAFQNGIMMNNTAGKYSFALYGIQPKQAIDRGTALSYANAVKNVIIEACDYVDANIFDTLQNYVSFDIYLKKICNRYQPNPYWDKAGMIKPSLLKYLHIFRPDLFSEFYVNGFQDKIASVIGVHDLDRYPSRIIRNGRILLRMKEIDENFDSVRFASALWRFISDKNIGDYYGESSLSESDVVDINDIIPLNLILYGPPGTGKTYEAVKRAVEIIDGKSATDGKTYREIHDIYNKYIDEGRIAFTTFHQSYGYEEFIEGIKPVLSDGSEDSDIKYRVESGIFKRFCEKAGKIKQTDGTYNPYGINRASTVWKISLDGSGRKKNVIHKECLDNGYIRIGWDSYGEDISAETEYGAGGKDILESFVSEMQIGDIVLSCYSVMEIDAIGVVTGEYEWHDEFPRLKRMRKVNWLYKWESSEKFNIIWYNYGNRLNNPTLYRLKISVDDVIKILNEHCQIENKIEYDYSDKYVFIIDEINRGNISKIFGELITLTESQKRLGAAEPMECLLPYSGKPFGIPKNVYILGTMNTADRSLVKLDAALRRRFDFDEKMPNYKVLRDVLNNNGVNIDDIDIVEMLSAINERITFFIDREHQIGHSYFINLKRDCMISDLARIFIKKVIPLLQEYFFDDYETIKKIMGNNNFIVKENLSDFVLSAENSYKSVYGINTDKTVFVNSAEYKKIYINNFEESESND